MLVLSRKIGEQIVIGDGIILTVTKIAAGRVGLGIQAPANVRIHRRELRPLDDKPAGPPPGFKPKGKPRKGGVDGETA